MPIIPLATYVENVKGQIEAAEKLGCSQPAIAYGLKKGTVFVEVDPEGNEIEAFNKRPFPDRNMDRNTKQKTPSAS